MQICPQNSFFAQKYDVIKKLYFIHVKQYSIGKPVCPKKTMELKLFHYSHLMSPHLDVFRSVRYGTHS